MADLIDDAPWPTLHTLRRGGGTCRSCMDGECFWSECPQLRDGEPTKTGRHCPLDVVEDEDDDE